MHTHAAQVNCLQPMCMKTRWGWRGEGCHLLRGEAIALLRWRIRSLTLGVSRQPRGLVSLSLFGLITRVVPLIARAT